MDTTEQDGELWLVVRQNNGNFESASYYAAEDAVRRAKNWQTNEIWRRTVVDGQVGMERWAGSLETLYRPLWVEDFGDRPLNLLYFDVLKSWAVPDGEAIGWLTKTDNKYGVISNKEVARLWADQ